MSHIPRLQLVSRAMFDLGMATTDTNVALLAILERLQQFMDSQTQIMEKILSSQIGVNPRQPPGNRE